MSEASAPHGVSGDSKAGEMAVVLYRELQHRTANLLNLASLQLEVDARQSDAGCRAALSRSAASLRHFAASQRRFDVPDWTATADAATEVTEAHAILSRTHGALRPGVRFDCVVEPDARFAVCPAGLLSLIVNELVTNAYKHAFRGRDGGSLRIALERTAHGRARLSVSDDGPGFGAGAAGSGHGMAIVEALARAIGGEVSVCGGGASRTTVRVTFDPERRRVRPAAQLPGSSR
jgi:two-component sensor histidine kinase